MVSFPSLLGYSSLALLGLRLVVAVAFVVHSKSKLKNPAHMAAGMKWPKWAVQLLGLVELLAALAIATGLWYQVGALALAVVMIGAIYHKIVSWKTPYYAVDKMGWEYDLILLASSLLILCSALGGYTL